MLEKKDSNYYVYGSIILEDIDKINILKNYIREQDIRIIYQTLTQNKKLWIVEKNGGGDIND